MHQTEQQMESNRDFCFDCYFLSCVVQSQVMPGIYHARYYCGRVSQVVLPWSLSESNNLDFLFRSSPNFCMHMHMVPHVHSSCSFYCCFGCKLSIFVVKFLAGGIVVEFNKIR